MATARRLSMPTLTAPIVSLGAVVLAAAALVLSAVALSDDGAAAPGVAVGGDCAWVRELGPDWLPAIGAEPPC